MIASRRVRRAVALAIAGGVLAGVPALARQHEGEKKGDGKSLSALMQSNRESLQKMVETAYVAGMMKKLEPSDYQQVRREAETVSANAKQIRQSFSRGEKFDKFARKLEEHAGKAARAAAEGDHPELNVELGEMAEYCAGCHNAFRW